MDLSDKVTEFLSEKNSKNNDRSIYIYEAWNEVIDSTIQQITTGIFLIPNINKNTLILYGKSDILCAELNMQRELIKDKINLYLNYKYKTLDFSIDHIIVKVSKYPQNFSNTGQVSVDAGSLKTNALTEDDTAEVNEIVKGIDDEELRKSLYDLIIESKKHQN